MKNNIVLASYDWRWILIIVVLLFTVLVAFLGYYFSKKRPKTKSSSKPVIKKTNSNKNNTLPPYLYTKKPSPKMSLAERRKRAEDAGWDEGEMDLEEFEDLFED